MSDVIKINQIDLIAAITKELGRQHSGLMVSDVDFNKIIEAANLICNAFDVRNVKDD